MCQEQLITLITGLATLITALVTGWMVYEMRRQIKGAQKPDLMAERTKYKVAMDEKVKHFTICSREQNDQALVGYIAPHLSIFNVGMGPAKNLNAKWSYDFASIQASIASFDHGEVVRFNRNGNQLEVAYIAKPETIGISVPDNTERSISFILPSSQSPLGFRLFFPISYCQLFDGWFYVAIERNMHRYDDGAELVNAPPPPEISVVIKYEDMLKNKYERKFRVKPMLHLGIISQEGSGKVTFINGSFQVEEY